MHDTVTPGPDVDHVSKTVEAVYSLYMTKTNQPTSQSTIWQLLYTLFNLPLAGGIIIKVAVPTFFFSLNNVSCFLRKVIFLSL